MGKSTIKNKGKDCWEGCNYKSGLCDWCGSGKCCHYDSAAQDGCKETDGIPNKGHVCMEAIDPAQEATIVIEENTEVVKNLRKS